MSTISAKGRNRQVSFDGQFVTITRKGGLARLTIGQSDKRIPVTTRQNQYGTTSRHCRSSRDMDFSIVQERA
jgi:hypothetical protein